MLKKRMNVSFSEIQQNQQEVSKGDVIAERMKSYGSSLVEKKDAGQTKQTDQGTTQPYKSSRFIIAFYFLILIEYKHITYVLYRIHICSP